MAEPFKNMYNKQFFDLFTKDLRLVIDDFDAHGFVSQIMDDEWEGRELKQRWIHITSILKKFLPTDYKEAIAKILELLDHVKSTRPDFSVIDDTKFGLMLEYGVILNNYVEQYGLDDYETSVKAIEKITQFTSCEFVTHPFIIKYPDEMMKQMLVWSKHGHWGVRPLSVYGDGIKKILYILNKLFDATDSILLIDEIETGLHKKYYDKLFPVVFELAKKLNVQLFIATHSMEAIDAILAYGKYDEENDNDPIKVITLKKVSSKERKGSNVVARNVTGRYVYDNRKAFEFEVRL